MSPGGTGGSNPPRSASQSAIFALSAENSKIVRTFARFPRAQGSGEAQILPSEAYLCSILSVENRAGAPSRIVCQKKRIRQDIAFQRGNPPLPFRANDVGNGANHSLHARNGANIPASPYGLGDLERMEHAKLANGRGA